MLALTILGFTPGALAADAPGPATDSPRPARVLTLADALAAAAAAPEVVVARAEERMSEIAIRLASAPAPPSLSLGTQSITAREKVSVSSAIRWGGQRRTAIEAARADLAAAVQSRQSARAAARRSVRVGWLTLAAAEQTVRIASARASRAARNAEAVKALFDAGRAPRIDVIRAEAELAVAVGEKNAAQEALGAAAADLGALIGREPGEPLKTGGALPAPAPEGPLEGWTTRVGTSSPGILVEQEKLRAARQHELQARKLRLPGLSVEVGADFDDPTQPGTDKSAGLTLSVPLDGSARASFAAAESARQASALERARRSALAGAESAWRSANAALARLDSLDSTALPAAREAADLARLAYQEGKLDLFRLLDSERALSEIETARWDAYLSWGVAHTDLLWFAGAEE